MSYPARVEGLGKYDKTVQFQTIQFSISTQFKCQTSIWPIDRTLSGATTLGQSRTGSDGNKGVFRIPQSSRITEASPSDCLMSYTGHSLGESNPSAEIQTEYSAAPAYWGILNKAICVSFVLILLEKPWTQLFFPQLCENDMANWVL